MENVNRYKLESLRKEHILNLGYICYNLYIDGVMTFPEMNELVKKINFLTGYLFNRNSKEIDSDNRKNREKSLCDNLTELGCVCYNLYIDNKPVNRDVLALCDMICTVNNELVESDVYNDRKAEYDYSDGNIDTYSNKDLYNPNYIKQEDNETEHSTLKINCPYGMEPIPKNFKKCVCGYRNRDDALFCGKCGAKLL